MKKTSTDCIAGCEVGQLIQLRNDFPSGSLLLLLGCLAVVGIFAVSCRKTEHDRPPASQWDRIEELAARDDREAIVTLAEAFEDERDIELRGRIARILASKGPGAVQPIVSVVSERSTGAPALGGSEPDVFCMFPTELYVPVAMMGADAVEPLLEMLEGGEEAPKAFIARTLGIIGAARAAGPLEDLLDGSPFVAAPAAEGLGAIGHRGSTEVLWRIVSTERPIVSAAAANSLGRLRYREGARLKVASVEEYSGSLKCEALLALARLGDEDAAAPLLEMLGDDINAQRAAIGLSELREERAVKPVAEIIDKKRGDSGDVSDFIYALGEIGGAEARPALLALATGVGFHQYERRELYVALGKAQAQSAAELLAKIARQRSEIGCSHAALLGLLLMGDEGADELIDEIVGADRLKDIASNHAWYMANNMAGREVSVWLLEGEASSIWLLCLALEKHGSLEMAENLYWSGQRDLRRFAISWARRHGLQRQLFDSQNNPARPRLLTIDGYIDRESRIAFSR